MFKNSLHREENGKPSSGGTDLNTSMRAGECKSQSIAVWLEGRILQVFVENRLKGELS